MNGVITAGRLLKRTSLSPEQEELVNIITQSSTSLLSVLNDVLDYSALEATDIALNSEEFRVKELVKDVIKTHCMDTGKQLHVSHTIGDTVPVFARGDATRIYQVVGNIVHNAVKFTECGDINVDVSCEDSPEVLLFTVKDTGVGMTQEVMNNLFTPFRQGEQFLTKKYHGSGLGLSICKKLIERMGGSIQVSSEFGAGTTFTFSIPVGVSSRDGCTTDGVTTPTTALLKHPRSMYNADANILVVEDSKVNQKVVLMVLGRLGYNLDHVQVAENGLNAVEMCGANVYDVVLMDIQVSAALFH
jgi:two-component system, sensor histidine kinase